MSLISVEVAERLLEWRRYLQLRVQTFPMMRYVATHFEKHSPWLGQKYFWQMV